MSQLDLLTSRSLSGVAMRPRAKPAQAVPADAVADAIANLANVLATGNQQLASTVANVLTSHASAAHQKVAREVNVVCRRDPDGAISGGTACNGETTWDMAVSTDLDGQVALTFNPR